MKRVTGKVVALAILVLQLAAVMQAADEPQMPSTRTDCMTVWQARRTVIANITAALNINVDARSFRFSFDTVEFDGVFKQKSREHFRVDLKSLESVGTKHRGGAYQLKAATGGQLPFPLDGLKYFGRLNAARNQLVSANQEDERNNAALAEGLAAALNRLRVFANDANAPLHTYAQQAASWRALATKPPVPEGVRIQRMLAEDAVKEKKPAEALNCYETGLELYPTWPQGYFNAALIAAELGLYAQAVEHMQAYLELVPDAPDAQSARDQVVIWQHKAR